MASFVVREEPLGKPRMAKRDKWMKRKCVVNYFNWKDRVKMHAAGQIPKEVPGCLFITAYCSMPPSWSDKKKAELLGKPHRQRPDIDNITKAFMDSLWEEDSAIWEIHCKKFWDDGNGARMEITII